MSCSECQSSKIGYQDATKMKVIAVLRANPKDATFGKILKALSKEFKVTCYVWDRQGDYRPIVENENLNYKRCAVHAGFYSVTTFLKMLVFDFWLFYRLIFAKVDYIHAIDLDTGLVGLCVAKLRKKRFIYHCIDPYYAILPNRWPKILGEIARKIENIVISQADFFIITDLLRMPQHKGAKPKLVVEIANVPMLNLQDVAYKHSTDGFVVGYIGSLVEGRNLMTIIDALGELEAEGVKLIIGGFGPIEKEVKARSRKYKNITYIGFIPYSEVLNIESSFDLFIYITDLKNEGQRWVSPNKLFESMALGKPIIVGEGTLVAKRVSMVGNGVVVKYGSKLELKKAILELKANPFHIKEMGEKGKEEFIRDWNIEIMEKKLLGVYKRFG